jgi:ABC-2 type transport system ATP-binding protein
MEEADKLCNRIAIIDHGKIIAHGAPLQLKESLGGDVISVETESGEKLHELLKELSWFKSGKCINGSLMLHVSNAANHIAELVKIADKHSISITSINMHQPTLEDVFLHYTGRKIREQEADPKESMRLRRKAFGKR